MNKPPNPDARFEERTLSSEAVFDGVLMKVWRDQVALPDGSVGIREYTQHNGAAMILPLFDDGRVLLERQFRYPLRQVFWEFPAGKLDPKEGSLGTAKRELREETGYTAQHWAFVGRIHPVISYSTEFIDFYLATGLVAGAAQLDEGEYLETEILPLDEVLAMIADGRMTDAKSVAGALWLDRIQRGLFVAKPV